MVADGATRPPVVLHLAPIAAGASNRLTLQLRLMADVLETEHICLAAVNGASTGRAPDEATRRLPDWPPRRAGEPAPVRKLKAGVRRGVNAVALGLWLWRSRARLLHAHELSSIGGLAFWVLVLRRPALWDPHDYYHPSPREGVRHPERWKLFLEKYLVRRAVPVLVVSDRMLALYRELYPHAKLFLVRNLSAKPIARASAESGEAEVIERRNLLAGGVTRVVYPGLVMGDRIELELVRALGSVDGVRLDIIGRDSGDGYTDRIRAFLAEHGIGNVRLLGAYSPDGLIDMIADYHYALFPYPLITENIDLCLPNKFFQCVEAGLPMLAARTAEMGGLIEENGLGLTYPAGEYDALAAAIRTAPGTSVGYGAMVRDVFAYRRDQVDYGREREALRGAYRAAIGEGNAGP